MKSNTRSLKMRKLVAPKQVESVESNDNNDLHRDPFEDLCDELICHILSFLPSKNVAQLSLLSHHWLYLWSIYPYLDFLKVKTPTSLLQISMPQRRVKLENYTQSIIRSSLLRRPLSSPATSKIFTFYLGGYLSSNGFNQCMNALAHDVEDLKLHVTFRGCYNLPGKLFTCKAMRSLELRVIPESPPRSSTLCGSFLFPIDIMVAWLEDDADPDLRSQLRTLYLDHVTFPSCTFASDIDFFSESYFPYLTSLSLDNCDGVGFLEISCPNLVYLHINRTEMEKLVLKTPQLTTLFVLYCFTETDERFTLVDICAPRLQVFHWTGNVVPSRFYVQAPTHVIYFDLSFLSLDIEEARVESATNLLSLRCMILGMGNDSLMVLAKLDFYGVNPRLCSSLSELILTTSMTKKLCLGIWFLLRASSALRYLCVRIFECFYVENYDNWGRESLDDRNISEAKFWELQYQYQAPILQHLEVVRIELRKDVERRDVMFVNFLLHHCKGVKIFDIIMVPTVSNEAFLRREQIKTGASDADIASRCVRVRTRSGTVFILSIGRGYVGVV